MPCRLYLHDTGKIGIPYPRDPPVTTLSPWLPQDARSGAVASKSNTFQVAIQGFECLMTRIRVGDLRRHGDPATPSLPLKLVQNADNILGLYSIPHGANDFPTKGKRTALQVPLRLDPGSPLHRFVGFAEFRKQTSSSRRCGEIQLISQFNDGPWHRGSPDGAKHLGGAASLLVRRLQITA